MEDNDVQLQLKKRARRRLVGAVFFVSLVALVLPMLMDHDPRPPVQDVEIRIPGQDEKPFAPAMVAVPVESAPAAEAAPKTPAVEAPAKMTVDRPQSEKMPEKAPEKPAEKPLEKPVDKPVKPAEKPLEKKAEKAPEKKPEPAKPAADEEARRAAAILAGKAPEPAAAGGAHVVLIGAFANEANVVSLRKKLGELGIKTYTEPLDSPQGKKTRVRAGPFPSREAAEKALDKMKRIGVSGVVTAKS
ncbi:DedD protein [Azonexus fungiphilus]|uniref:DedD protein n=1 Tax=Azonexus fungiphilus TaxID=146940 RepID=A0A495WCX1_9RHOO|nr:SPOR domain-containing protein [Azonexus fungiphilus]NHC06160.1 SPOR domain-containing protein [Azonexus fungiphilus]RKT59486.1 DedD protein [Azonexus fungiphilus]